MRTVFVEGHGECEVFALPKISSPKQHRYRYTPESFEHPAKMDVVLCRKIIETYTREGETVLDPMSGIGTTLSEAVLLGRNAVGVELEGKFVKLSEKNIRLLKKIRTLAPKGKAAVIKGDSRKLSGILREKADKVIFSPPYRERYAYKNPEERQKDDPTASKRNRIHKPYSQDPNNIGNLKYGKPVDAVVTSPPFADAEHHYKHGLKVLGKNFKGRKAWEGKERVQSEPENIGNLKYGKPVDAVVTSPPFFSTVQERGYQGHGKHNIAVDPAKHGHKGIITLYAQSKENIDNIEKYGQVDAIVTSPPYADTPLQDYATSNKALLSFERKVRESFREKGYYEFNGKRYTEREWRRINKGELKPRGMPELWRQIISQRKGSRYSEIARVDAIVTSPPFAGTSGGKGKKSREPINARYPGLFERCIGGNKGGISNDPKNIDNKPYGSVDAIVTSPPFAQAQHGGGIAKHGYDGPRHGKTDLVGKRSYMPENVGEGKGNISRMPYGRVDSVIFSPPYSESMSKRRKGYTTHPELSKTRHMGLGSSDENIGNLKHGEISHVDAIVTSPSYEGLLESTTRHTKGGIPKRDKKLGQTGFYPSENRDNIGSKKGETYLQAMFQVYRECYKTLKPGGKMVLVLKNFIRNFKVKRLDLDTKRLCEAAGFRWVETRLFKLYYKSFWRTQYAHKYPNVDTSLLRFEFVEVFEKPPEAWA